MPNQYVNEVIYNGQTLIDLQNDSVEPSKVLQGETFHDRSGTPQTGSLITHNVYDGLDSTSTSDALSANKGKELKESINSLSANITDLNRCTLTILSAMSSKIQVTEGGIYTRGKTYIVNFSLRTSSEISTGETKLATVSPAPKERMAGIVLQISNTKQVGSFQITRAGDIWVYMSENVASNKDITLCAYGLVS